MPLRPPFIISSLSHGGLLILSTLSGISARFQVRLDVGFRNTIAEGEYGPFIFQLETSLREVKWLLPVTQLLNCRPRVSPCWGMRKTWTSRNSPSCILLLQKVPQTQVEPQRITNFPLLLLPRPEGCQLLGRYMNSSFAVGLFLHIALHVSGGPCSLPSFLVAQRVCSLF